MFLNVVTDLRDQVCFGTNERLPPLLPDLRRWVTRKESRKHENNL